eukprot:2935359-Rhodomonas_salina.1
MHTHKAEVGAKIGIRACYAMSGTDVAYGATDGVSENEFEREIMRVVVQTLHHARRWYAPCPILLHSTIPYLDTARCIAPYPTSVRYTEFERELMRVVGTHPALSQYCTLHRTIAYRSTAPCASYPTLPRYCTLQSTRPYLSAAHCIAPYRSTTYCIAP